MKIAILSPVAWRTPPRHYGPWEQIAWNTAEGLIARGHEVTLFATADSYTSGRLEAVVPAGWEEDKTLDPKVMEYLHNSFAMEMADGFDIVHNHFDFMPLSYSKLVKTPMVTTIHGFSSEKIKAVYRKYNGHVGYFSISNSDRDASLDYIATVYNGLDPKYFDFQPEPQDYLLYFGRMHPDKGPHDAIQIALKANKKLLMAGIVQDEDYFKEKVSPWVDGEQIVYIGSAGPERRNQLLGNALALLHPIYFAEPFGLSVAESMLCGTPVISYPLGSMPELIKHEKTGFLVKDVDKAVEALQSLGCISRAECRRHSMAKFSLEAMVAGYEKGYEEWLSVRA